jgi:hypothetical protein
LYPEDLLIALGKTKVAASAEWVVSVAASKIINISSNIKNGSIIINVKVHPQKHIHPPPDIVVVDPRVEVPPQVGAVLDRRNQEVLRRLLPRRRGQTLRVTIRQAQGAIVKALPTRQNNKNDTRHR